MTRKRASIKDVANLAGVSYQTVSKVLNGQNHVSPLKAKAIHEAAKQLGYTPNHTARNLRAQRSRMIGYSWVTAKADPAHHILDMFLTSMVVEAEAAGYHLLPFPYREGDEALISSYNELIVTGRVDGFILSSLNYNDPRVEFLTAQNFPFVAFGRSNPELKFPYVDVDGAAGLRQATEHLIQRGHQRIAALAWAEDSRVGNDRMEGYLTALQAAGLPIRPDFIARGEGTYEFGLAATEQWLTLSPTERPTAIVAVTDTMAIGAMRAIHSNNLMPGKDVAVIGFDDTPMARFLWPPLTTIRQPIREAGHKCVEILVNVIEGRNVEPQSELLQPELIVRETG